MGPQKSHLIYIKYSPIESLTLSLRVSAESAAQLGPLKTEFDQRDKHFQ